jgi:hypothetical protein
MIEGTDGVYYLQAGAILIPGSSLSVSCSPLRFSPTTVVVSDMQTQARGVSKTKPAFHSTQFTRLVMYRTVSIFFFFTRSS